MSIIDVRTDVTGALLRIDVEVGQTIDEDDPILTLESMKMHIPVTAPQKGKILELLDATLGDVITEGQIIAKLEV